MSKPIAFATGVGLALSTSAAIAGERLSEGSFRVGVAANVLVTIAALLALALTSRLKPSGALLPQLAGAAVGIALVHLGLHFEAASAAPWLAETPAQLVNDGVAALATLAAVWACARDLDARVLAGALLAVTAYRATSSHWHLDRPPHGFAWTVQELVVAQFAAAAIALAIYQRASRTRA